MGHRIGIAVLAIIITAPSLRVDGQEKAPAADAGAILKDARRLLRNGRYAEAEEVLSSIESDFKKEPKRAVPGLSVALPLTRAECQASQGEYAKAIEGLQKAASSEPKSADLPARIAELYLTRGDWDAAAAAMRQAEKLDPDHMLARWVEARLLELRGEIDKAVEGWKWFV